MAHLLREPLIEKVEGPERQAAPAGGAGRRGGERGRREVLGSAGPGDELSVEEELLADTGQRLDARDLPASWAKTPEIESGAQAGSPL